MNMMAEGSSFSHSLHELEKLLDDFPKLVHAARSVVHAGGRKARLAALPSVHFAPMQATVPLEQWMSEPALRIALPAGWTQADLAGVAVVQRRSPNVRLLAVAYTPEPPPKANLKIGAMDGLGEATFEDLYAELPRVIDVFARPVGGQLAADPYFAIVGGERAVLIQLRMTLAGENWGGAMMIPGATTICLICHRQELLMIQFLGFAQQHDSWLYGFYSALSSFAWTY